jgi:prefoldin subunit 5
MSVDPWNAHIAYLEAQVSKLAGRAGKLEAMIPDCESAEKKVALRELVNHLRDEAAEHSKYLALVKQK